LLSSFTHFIVFAFLIRVITLAIQVWIIMYLLKPGVKAAFQGAARAASA
jgi:hypothetical protein